MILRERTDTKIRKRRIKRMKRSAFEAEEESIPEHRQMGFKEYLKEKRGDQLQNLTDPSFAGKKGWGTSIKPGIRWPKIFRKVLDISGKTKAQRQAEALRLQRGTGSGTIAAEKAIAKINRDIEDRK